MEAPSRILLREASKSCWSLRRARDQGDNLSPARPSAFKQQVSGPVHSALQKEGMQRAALGRLRSHLEMPPSLLLTFTDQSRDLSDPTKSRDCPSCDWKDEKPCRQRGPEDAPQTCPETNTLGEV